MDGAESRLREAHRRWHECLDSYQEPEDFRDALNAALQALRNVTFMLQKAKSQIPGFDEWYSGEQDVMRADPVMRWVVQARNQVVKEGDLATHSWMCVKIIASYEDEAEEVRLDQETLAELLPGAVSRPDDSVFSPPVRTTPGELRSSLVRIRGPLRARQNATLVVERRWTVDELPKQELLTLLAHAYGRLRMLLSGAHNLLGLSPGRVLVTRGPSQQAPEMLEELPFSGRLPCMLTTRPHRESRFRLIDGTEVTEYTSQQVDPDPSITDETLQARYGDRPTLPSDVLTDLQSADELRVLLDWYASLAERVLLSGEDHGFFTHYYRKGRQIGHRIHAMEDTQGKVVVAADIARFALTREADVVVLLSEAWVSPMSATVDGGYIPPGVHPEKTEAMMIGAVAKSGIQVSVTIPFDHLSGGPPNRHVKLLPQVWDEVHGLGMLLPILRAWGFDRTARQGDSFFKRRPSSLLTDSGR